MKAILSFFLTILLSTWGFLIKSLNDANFDVEIAQGELQYSSPDHQGFQGTG